RPWFAEVPAVVPARAFRSILADLIHHGCRRNQRLEAVRSSESKSRNGSAVGVANQRETLAVERGLRERCIDTCHDVAIVDASQIVFERGEKLDAVTKAAARINVQYRPSLLEQQPDEWIVAVFESSCRTAMHAYYQWNAFVRGCTGRHIEKAIY